MDAAALAALSALGGALIGSFSSVATIYIQTKIKDRRDRLKHAAELALEDHKGQMELLKNGSVHGVFPLLTHFHLYLRLMDAAERPGFGSNSVKEILDEQDIITDLVLSRDKMRRKPTRGEQV